MKLWLALAVVSFAAVGADSPDSWQEHKRGPLSWSARGVVSPDQGLCQHPSVDCRKVLVEVRNDRSDAPIYCGASVLFPQPNAYSMREKGWQDYIAVEPGRTAAVNSAWVPKDLEVKEIYTECHPKRPVLTANAIMDVTDRPPPPMPPPPPVAGCSTRMQSAADPDAYYPPAAKAENREGTPIIRATVRKGQTKPHSVVLVTSSGQADFDEAGLEVARQSRYFTSCEEGAVTFKVKFRVVDVDAT